MSHITFGNIDDLLPRFSPILNLDVIRGYLWLKIAPFVTRLSRDSYSIKWGLSTTYEG
jgi:hypothetical protein